MMSWFMFTITTIVATDGRTQPSDDRHRFILGSLVLLIASTADAATYLTTLHTRIHIPTAKSA